ncbi:MAG: hypothetical protein M3Y17_15655 [Actinomycetota bacterium]|nr:hypothetical protein [Actinomycetota bacterium]
MLADRLAGARRPSWRLICVLAAVAGVAALWISQSRASPASGAPPPSRATLAANRATAVPAAGAAQPVGACAAPSGAAPDSHTVSLVVDGRRRFALVHVPHPLPAGRRLPLVLALHGYGGSGPRMEPYSGFSRQADEHGFVVAYPSSLGLAWNSTGAAGGPDDVAFMRALIAALEHSMCIDPERVLGTGVSNGGGMVALAGCELSSQIEAIAPVAGGYDGQPPCRPTRPLSVLEIHGTADQVVPYFGRTRRPTRDGVPPFVNAWVARDRCSPRAGVRALAPGATIYRWQGCAGGVRVEHIKIAAGHHQWPGATPPDPGPPSAICAACTIWSFFSGLPAGTRAWPVSPSSPVRGSSPGSGGAPLRSSAS